MSERCSKCGMDPCLCHLDGFAKDNYDDTAAKDYNEMIGRRVVINADQSNNEKLKTDFRPSGIEGVIKKGGIHGTREDIIKATIFLQSENKSEEFETNIRPVFYVEFYEFINMRKGNWYFEDELILL